MDTTQTYSKVPSSDTPYNPDTPSGSTKAQPTLSTGLETILTRLQQSLRTLELAHRKINGMPEEKDLPEEITPSNLEELIQKIFSCTSNIGEVSIRLEGLI